MIIIRISLTKIKPYKYYKQLHLFHLLSGIIMDTLFTFSICCLNLNARVRE